MRASVKQIITGSIGFDDWEWGVDLFAEDPLVFKRLIYEMRFDEVSAIYALFGTFYVGRRMDAEDLAGPVDGVEGLPPKRWAKCQFARAQVLAHTGSGGIDSASARVIGWTPDSIKCRVL